MHGGPVLILYVFFDCSSLYLFYFETYFIYVHGCFACIHLCALLEEARRGYQGIRAPRTAVTGAVHLSAGEASAFHLCSISSPSWLYLVWWDLWLNPELSDWADFALGEGQEGVLNSQVCVASDLSTNPSLWPTNSSVKGREWWVMWDFVATSEKKKQTALLKTLHAGYLLICWWIIHVLVWSLFNFLDGVETKPVPRETLRSWLGSLLYLFRGPHDLKYLWKY